MTDSNLESTFFYHQLPLVTRLALKRVKQNLVHDGKNFQAACGVNAGTTLPTFIQLQNMALLPSIDSRLTINFFGYM